MIMPLVLRRLLLGALFGAPLALAVAQSTGSAPPANAWPGSTVLYRADYPRIVSAGRGGVTLLVAPFLRGVQDGTSGLLTLNTATGATDALFRSSAGMLPNHLGPVLDDGAQLYWLNGLRIMQTSRQTRQTKLLSDKGALAMALHAGAVFTFNHNNERKLLRIDTGSGQVSELATLPFVANTLHADANGVWLLTSPSPLRQSSAVVRFDLASRQSTDVVVAADSAAQIRALVPYAATSTPAASSSFAGLYLVERNVRSNRVSVKHYDIRSGQLTTLPIDAIDELSPMRADASALYYFAPESRQFGAPVVLYRHALAEGKAQPLSRGSTPATSLWVLPGEGATGRVLWTDLARVYTVDW